jgi:UDP-N-acetylglucosamine 2-epimerase (non-hydrolysing)
MGRSALILTDSGGVQEEAPSLGKPVLVAREGTERPEGVEAGLARLVGTSVEGIVGGVSALLGGLPPAAGGPANPYGDGQASRRIVELILGRLAG